VGFCWVAMAMAPARFYFFAFPMVAKSSRVKPVFGDPKPKSSRDICILPFYFFVYCNSILLYFFLFFSIFFYFFLFFSIFLYIAFLFFVYFCTLHLVKKAPGELPIFLYIAFLFFCILLFYFFVYCIFIFLYVAFALAAPACVLAACAWLLFGAAAACLMRAQCVGGMVVRCTHVCHRVVSHAWCTRQLVASP
jgi:hypothetical protein